MPVGYIGVNYPQTFYLTHTDGTPPLTWSVTAGSLPAGLTRVTENGNTSGSRLYIQGSPTTAGLSTVTIEGLDQDGRSSSVTFAIIVTVAPGGGGGVDPFQGGGEVLGGSPGDYEDKFPQSLDTLD